MHTYVPRSCTVVPDEATGAPLAIVDACPAWLLRSAFDATKSPSHAYQRRITVVEPDPASFVDALALCDLADVLSDERVEVQRTTTPTLHVNENRVDVRFDVRIHAVDDGSERQLHEIHSMRYLFLPELDLLFAQTGFERSAAHAWMSGAAPGDRSWYASVSARAT